MKSFDIEQNGNKGDEQQNKAILQYINKQTGDMWKKERQSTYSSERPIEGSQVDGEWRVHTRVLQKSFDEIDVGQQHSAAAITSQA